MDHAFAPRHNRLEDGPTGEPREKVLKINVRKDKMEVRSKEFFKPSSSSFAFKALGQQGHTFFDRKDFGLELVERKTAQQAFQTKNEGVKMVKQSSPAKASQKPTLIPWRKDLFSPEIPTPRKRETQEDEAAKTKKELITYEQDVMNNLLESQRKYRLKEIDAKNKPFFAVASEAICRVGKVFSLREETIIHALYLVHFVCSVPPKKDPVVYIVPCVMIAAKVEEYYPPSISDVIRALRSSLEMMALKGFDKVDNQLAINAEMELMNKLGYSCITPQVMDIANILLNKLGKFSKDKPKAIFPYIKMILMKQDAFMNSLTTIAAASIRLFELIKDEFENVFARDRGQDNPKKFEAIDRLLYDTYEYKLNESGASALLRNAQQSIDNPCLQGFTKPEQARVPPASSRFFAQKLK